MACERREKRTLEKRLEVKNRIMMAVIIGIGSVSVLAILTISFMLAFR